jgi:arabinofuranan 3-O-arabinosyltransferase
VSAESDPGGYIVSRRMWAWLGTRRSHALLLWLLTLIVGGYLLWHAFKWFDIPSNTPEDRRRTDGNGGHVQIDFGGQWLMGRMVVCGHGRELYHRQRLWEVARDAFPVENEDSLSRTESIVPGPLRVFAKPDEDLKHDADRMMGWFMGSDAPEWRVACGAVAAPLAMDPFGNPFFAAALQGASTETLTPAVVEKVSIPAIGGPLYPPIHAFFYAPLGAIDHPQQAYRVFQVIAALFVFLAGLGIKVLSRGRIWWSIGTLILFLYPGTRGGLDLGQNPTITLAIAIWGWVLAARGYNVAGGMIWGLFAFKPIWGLAFFLVPVLTRRWRFCIAMVLTGVGLAAATLPFVGLQTWFDWLSVGKEAAALYNVNKNWITLSRDLQGIPRRILHDFSLPEAERDTTLAKTLAWSLWGVVIATTTWIYLRYGDRQRSTGVGIGFLFFGAFLTCYRFMYYDLLLSAVGFAALLSEPKRFLRTHVFGLTPVSQTPVLGTARELNPPQPTTNILGSRLLGYINSFPLTVLVLLLLVENSFSGMNLQATLGFGYYARVTTGADGATGIATPRVEADSGSSNPMDTYLIFMLWMWCGLQLIRGEERRSVPVPGR